MRRIRSSRRWTHVPWRESISAYNGLVDTQGRGAGIAFYDSIVVPFAQFLSSKNRLAEARQAAERARAMLYIPVGSQLEGEFNRLFKELDIAVPMQGR